MPSRRSSAPTPTEEFLLQPVSHFWTRVVGAVCLLLGIGIAAVTLYFLYLAVGRRAGSIGILVVLASFALITWFMTSVGYRLAFLRPNSYGSLVSHRAWWFLAILFFVLAVLGLAFVALSQNISQMNGVISALLLSLFCYAAATHFKRKRKRKRKPSEA